MAVNKAGTQVSENVSADGKTQDTVSQGDKDAAKSVTEDKSKKSTDAAGNPKNGDNNGENTYQMKYKDADGNEYTSDVTSVERNDKQLREVGSNPPNDPRDPRHPSSEQLPVYDPKVDMPNVQAEKPHGPVEYLAPQPVIDPADAKFNVTEETKRQYEKNDAKD